MQNKKEETKKQSERDTLEYRNRMKNSQLEIRYRTGENLLWVDNDNRLCAEHSIQILYYRIQKKEMECGKIIQNSKL